MLRIDHVVGLYRTFNFGSDFAEPGVFTPVNENDELRQGEEVIRAIKEEAGATELIAEDLGTVPPWVRASLTQLAVAGYKVMQWERDWGHGDEPFLSPATYPELSLATTGTHDTEPLTVWWRAQPVQVREKFVRALGLEGKVSPRRMLEESARFAILAALYAAPSKLVIVPIQDLFGWSAQINRPGTISEWNWTYRIPLTLERMRRSRAIQSQTSPGCVKSRLRAGDSRSRKSPSIPSNLTPNPFPRGKGNNRGGDLLSGKVSCGVAAG